MTEKLLIDNEVFLIDKNSQKESASALKTFNFSFRTKMFVDDALASKKSVLVIISSKTNSTKGTSVHKTRTQNDFATLIRQVEKEVYGRADY